jgi:hydroxypyruvate reductase
MRADRKRHAREIFRAALECASPAAAVKRHLRVSRGGALDVSGTRYDLNNYSNVFVIGGGKASTAMAGALEEELGEWITDGLVVTKYGHGKRLKKIRVVEADHPIPDRSGLKGSRELLKLAERARDGDLVICLLSGGASALLPSPVPPVTLNDIRVLTKQLINSGAEIREINTVRKHMSNIKGGALARVIHPAESLTLIVSDVVGDDPSTIASGPTTPDGTTFADSIEVLNKYGLKKTAPRGVLARLSRGLRGMVEETPKPGSKAFRKCRNFIIANNEAALEAAKKRARGLGYRAVILTSILTGGTHEAARFLSAVVKEVRKSSNPVKPPACILLGGETTVEVRGRGLGGRNQEFALKAALELQGVEGVTVLAAGTDGTDGPTTAAGAFADTTTVKRARKMGLDAWASLRENDSHTFFKATGDLLTTGPTGTNVMDLVVAVIE